MHHPSSITVLVLLEQFVFLIIHQSRFVFERVCTTGHHICDTCTNKQYSFPQQAFLILETAASPTQIQRTYMLHTSEVFVTLAFVSYFVLKLRLELQK